jgi:hypothetical protein
MLPALALGLPPIVLLIGVLLGWQRGRIVFAAFQVLGLFSPILGLTTLIVLVIRWLRPSNVEEPAQKGSHVLAGWLAILAIVAPVWLIVMYLFAIGFNR